MSENFGPPPEAQFFVELVFRFNGDFPAGLLESLAVAPQKVRRRGEMDGAKTRPEFSLLSYRSDSTTTRTGFVKSLEGVLTIPLHDIEALREGADFCCVNIVIKRYESFNGLKIPSSLVDLASRIGGGVDIFFYDYLE